MCRVYGGCATTSTQTGCTYAPSTGRCMYHYQSSDWLHYLQHHLCFNPLLIFVVQIIYW